MNDKYEVAPPRSSARRIAGYCVLSWTVVWGLRSSDALGAIAMPVSPDSPGGAPLGAGRLLTRSKSGRQGSQDPSRRLQALGLVKDCFDERPYLKEYAEHGNPRGDNLRLVERYVENILRVVLRIAGRPSGDYWVFFECLPFVRVDIACGRRHSARNANGVNPCCEQRAMLVNDIEAVDSPECCYTIPSAVWFESIDKANSIRAKVAYFTTIAENEMRLHALPVIVVPVPMPMAWTSREERMRYQAQQAHRFEYFVRDLTEEQAQRVAADIVRHLEGPEPGP